MFRSTPLIVLMLAVSASSQTKEFPIHSFHKHELGGSLDCGICHVPVKSGSVVLKRPGHGECVACHSADFSKDPNRLVCAQCHWAFPPEGSADLISFPRHRNAVIADFSHARHMDQKARVDSRTGFRADCTFCHKFDAQGAFATFPAHEQCAACHSKPGMKPRLSADVRASDCQGCHAPDEQTARPPTVQARYQDIVFSHAAHFKVKDQFKLNCTTCHDAIPSSRSIRELSLPTMINCVQCHESARTMKAAFRIGNCRTCHEDTASDTPMPSSHTRSVKPDFHTEVFRRHHEAEAAAPNAKCFVCHQNLSASTSSGMQCSECHQAMRPASHTARWKDDLHGKYAALDRNTCATCHTAAYCSDCHNQTPRSHQPLPMFKAGAHAFPAQLNLSTCFTCHTFQNTCRACHINKLG